MCEKSCKFGCLNVTSLTESYMGDLFCSLACVIGYIRFSTGDNYYEALETYNENKDWVDPDPKPTKISFAQAEQEVEDFNLFTIKCEKCGTPTHEYFLVNYTRTCSEQCRSHYVSDEEYHKVAPGEDDMYYTESDQSFEIGDILWDADGKEYEVT